MAQWQKHLRIKTEWKQAQDGEITTQQLASVIGKKLTKMWESHQDDDELLDLSLEFEEMAENPNLAVDEFDCVMDRLYDWGDTPLDDKWNGKKMCWIETF